MKFLHSLTAIAVAAALSACGGDDEKNVAPIATDDSYTATVGATNTIDVLANDSDENTKDTLSVTAVTQPDSGSVTINSDGTLSFEPSGDTLGDDSFTYTVSDGELDDTATVSLTVQQALAFSGKVVDAAIPNATVTITIGEDTFTTTADEDGNYTLEVFYTDGTKLVKIEAVGSADNEQDHVDLTSLMPSLATLQGLAGDDAIVQRSEAGGTNVTNVTTASYVLTKEANGGEDPADENTLSAAESNIDGTKVLEIAAVIKVIVDNPDFDLPDGVSTIGELINDETAYNDYVAYVENTDPTALQAAADAIVEDEELTVASTQFKLPAFYIQLPTTQPGFIARGDSTLYFNDDGTGVYINGFFGLENETDFTWSRDDNGYYALDFATPAVYIDYPAVTDETDDATILAAYDDASVYQVETEVSVSALAFKLLVDGKTVDLVQAKETYTKVYQPLNGVDGKTYQIPTAQGVRKFQYSYLNGDALPKIAGTEADLTTQQWVLPIVGLAAPGDMHEALQPDLITFNSDGSFGSDYAGVDGEWSLTDSIISMSYTSEEFGDVEQKVQIVSTKNGVYTAFVEVSSEAANATWYDWVAPRDPEYTIDPADLVNTAATMWLTNPNIWYASQWDQAENLPSVFTILGWQFDEAGKAYRTSVGCQEYYIDGTCTYDSTLVVLNNSTRNYRVIEDSSGQQRIQMAYNFECFGAGNQVDANCAAYEYIPLQEAENGQITLLESVFVDRDPSTPVNLVSGFTPRVTVSIPFEFPQGIENSAFPGATASSGQAMPAGKVDRVSFLGKTKSAPLVINH
ncbi:hypothetical protein CWI84_06355 [Idiomarina tyrosinivorans]|uniref:Cadherin-like domain-containing protein n=1 Tax=Idiomarina tyrosinivorans TaxID=1445662 RepID=A0A432ZQS1_9GAMM|nr:Ig-like domain-containing protein [Idiomarina tyrosinivorans]RUO80250.1 hypothetical protein CWI84_06355 [Idiomarina tyrosinivorans]